MTIRAAGSRALLCALALGAAAPAGAENRLSIGPIAGDPKLAIHNQLVSELCRAGCIPFAQLSAAGRPDLEKARARGAGILAGSVTRQGGRRVLRLELSTAPRQKPRRFRLTLGPGGMMGAAEMARLQKELRDLVEPVRRAPEPAAALPPPRVEPRPVPLPPPPPAAPRPVARPEAGPSQAMPAAAPPRPAAPSAQAEPWIAVEAGLDVTNRKLSYGGSGTGTGTLLTFDVPAIWSPRARLEVQPLGGRSGGALAGLGLHADYARSLGLKTEEAGTGRKSPTVFTQLHVGVHWRTPPLTGLRLRLVPAIGYQWISLEASPGIAGLPDAKLAGPRAALGVELPVSEAVTILGGLGYVRWLTARELVKGTPAFFPGGSAWAAEAELGLAVRLVGPIWARALFDFRYTDYILETDPTGTYVATSAVDRILGGRLMLRAEY